MTRIMLADDHALVRQGFRMILSAQPDMEIVGEAGNGREEDPADWAKLPGDRNARRGEWLGSSGYLRGRRCT